jgi:hypothetical protein
MQLRRTKSFSSSFASFLILQFSVSATILSAFLRLDMLGERLTRREIPPSTGMRRDFGTTLKTKIQKQKLDDPAAAEDFFFGVEDCGLAGGDGALGFVERDAGGRRR